MHSYQLCYLHPYCLIVIDKHVDKIDEYRYLNRKKYVIFAIKKINCIVVLFGWAIYSNCLTSFLGVANMYIYNTKVVDSGQL